MQARGDLGPLAQIEYPDRFHAATGPFDLALAAALQGTAPPVRRGEEFTYGDLGCGTGLGCAVLAAAVPEGRFVGIDVLPAHVEKAGERAREAGLDNATFHCADLREHRRLPLPGFDIVVAHGLYTWVAPDVRRAVVDLLGSRLRPGGLAALSYNALPGWGGLAALREWVRHRARAIGGSPVESVPRALEEAASLLERGSSFPVEGRGAARVIAKLRASDPRYLAHELLAPFGEPASFREVATDLSRAGLAFVGSALPAECCPACSLPEGCREAIEGLDDPLERETLRDQVVNRFYRFDLFRRPGPVRDADPLDDVLLGLDRPAAEVPSSVPAFDGEVSLGADWFEPVKEVLARCALTEAALLAEPALRAYPAAELREGLRLLHAGGHLRAFRVRGDPPPEALPERVRVVPRLNRLRIDRLEEEGGGVTLASPVSGTGRRLDLLEALALSALTRERPEAWLAREACRRGLLGGGTADEGEVRRRARSFLAGFREGLLPMLLRLGLTEPRG